MSDITGILSANIESIARTIAESRRLRMEFRNTARQLVKCTVEVARQGIQSTPEDTEPFHWFRGHDGSDNQRI